MQEWSVKWNQKNIIIACLLGFFCSCGLMLSLTSEATAKNSRGLDLKNETVVYVRTLYLSFSSDRLRTFLLLLTIGVLVYWGREIAGNTKERILLLLFSGTFAFAQLIGMSYKAAGSWNLLFEGRINQTRACMKGLSYAILVYYVLKLLYYYVRKYLLQGSRDKVSMVKDVDSAAEGRAGNARSYGHGAADKGHVAKEKQSEKGTLGKWLAKGKGILSSEVSPRAFWLSVGLMLLCWLPYFIIFYPGTGNKDTVVQIMEFFHIRNHINEMTVPAWSDAFITNHHPYLLTLLFGGFIRLGLMLGDVHLGVAVYSLFHMLFLACIFSGGLLYLNYAGVPVHRIRFIRCLVMFLPIFPLYSICMVKDTIYAAFCLIYILMMHETVRTNGEVLKSVKFDMAMFLLGSLMMLTKVYGMYILLVVGVVYLLHYRKYMLRTVLVVFVPAVLYKFVFLGWLLPALGVAPAGIQEGLSVMIQQTSRYVVEYGDEVTAKERAAIDGVLVYEDIPKDYDPELSDRVKQKWRQDYTQEELSAYFEAWFQMFLKHPGVYVESVLHNTYQYYDINKISGLEYYEFDTFLQEYDEDGKYSWLYVENLPRFEATRYVVNQLVLLLQKLPGPNVFVSMGLLPWILWFFVYLYVFEGRGKCVEALLIPILTFAVCVLSPDNGNYRYIMPIIFALPYLGVLALSYDSRPIRP